MVILYRGALVHEIEYRLFHRSRVRFIGMPNIILDRAAFPELIQHAASPEGIASAALPLLTDQKAQEQARENLATVRAVLGEPGGVGRTADLILDLVGGCMPNNGGIESRVSGADADPTPDTLLPTP
jgi:lipid-A-disaccharide synthase